MRNYRGTQGNGLCSTRYLRSHPRNRHSAHRRKRTGTRSFYRTFNCVLHARLHRTCHFEILKTGSAYELINNLQQGRIDLAFFHTDMSTADGIMQRVLVKTQSVVFHDSDMRTPPTDLDSFCERGHALLSLGPDAHSDVDATLESLGRSRRVALRVADFDTLAHLIRKTSMVATLPEIFKYSCFQDFDCAPLPWKSPSVSWTILWHARQHDAMRSRFWRQCVSDSCSAATWPGSPTT